MIKCILCEKELTREESVKNRITVICFECDINESVRKLAEHMREARITFEEMIRKLINEVDK